MTTTATRIGITGAGGRLGTALVAAAEASERRPLPWRRPAFDLDDPDPIASLIAADRPDLIVHAAAWTDVDGCARDPELALRRNALATAVVARAASTAGVPLVVISTNEVFDGTRTDGQGYREDDPTGPPNAYGRSKLAAETAAAAAFANAGSPLWIVRVAWLYGPPGDDFPERIVRAADRLPPDEALPVVADEVGSPTFTHDLAGALLDLVDRTEGGTYHLSGTGTASRLEWAAATLDRLRPARRTRPIGRASFQRASSPPAWGVLDTGRAAAAGVRLRPWQDALRERLDAMEPAGSLHVR